LEAERLILLEIAKDQIKDALLTLANLTDGRKTYFLAGVQLFANAAMSLQLVHISFDVMCVGNAVLAILIWLARSFSRYRGWLVKTNDIPE
jgi:hypothetical protein